MALRGMSQANMNLGISQETEITDGVYTRGLDWSRVVSTDAPSRHRDGVAVFYQSSTRFAVEVVQKFWSKVVGFQMVTGEWRWYIIGCYLAPDDTSMIEIVVTAPKEQPRDAELLVAGEFNMKPS